MAKMDTVEVHVLDPFGNYTAQWVIGDDVPADMVDQFRDPATKNLYAVTVYRAGEPEISLATYSAWLQVKAAMGG